MCQKTDDFETHLMGSSATSMMQDVVYWKKQNRFFKQDRFLIPNEL